MFVVSSTNVCFLCLYLYVVAYWIRVVCSCVFFFQAEDGIRDLVRSRGLGDVYKRQVNAKALEVFDQAELVDRSRAIADLGKDHVLLFFYRSDCPYCHAFAPTLAAFQARHGIPVSYTHPTLPTSDLV